MTKTCANCARGIDKTGEECSTCEMSYNRTTGVYSGPTHWIPAAVTEVKEAVNHPGHYQTKEGLEAIDVIRAFTADMPGIEAFDTGNVLKYMCRWKHKNGIEDLKKAKWYLENLINYIEEENDQS